MSTISSFLRKKFTSIGNIIPPPAHGYNVVNFNENYANGATIDRDIKVASNFVPPSIAMADNYRYFDRLYSIYPEYEMTPLRHYVFIVRPDLNIVSESAPASGRPSATCQYDNFVSMMCSAYNVATLNLTDKLDRNHDFMSFLVGRTESLQLPDLTIKNSTISQPFSNYLMPYSGNTNESQTGGEFSITFREDSELTIHKTFQLWIYYMDAVKKNIFSPKYKYIQNNQFDYMSSVYQIVCAPDAQKILWWGKYTGVFPLNVPNSNFSFNLRGGVDNKVSISFAYFMFEPLNPDILVDFNANAQTPSSTIPLYDEYMLGTGSGMVGVPHIGIYQDGTPALLWGTM